MAVGTVPETGRALAPGCPRSGDGAPGEHTRVWSVVDAGLPASAVPAPGLSPRGLVSRL